MEFNEYRGVRGLVLAEITDGENYEAGEWQELSGVQQVAVSKSESSESKFYDNAPRIVIDAEGADEITLVVSVLDNKTRALIEGVEYDAKTDMLINTPKQRKYFALGYIGKKTNGVEEFNICYKGKFTGGGETHDTETDGTESTNVEYTFTAIHTSAKIRTKADGTKTTAKSVKLPATKVTELQIFGNFTAGKSTVKPLTPDEISALVTE